MNVPPASNCPRCYRPGVPAEDQYIQGRPGDKRLTSIRFECHHCITEWTANRAEAEAHGRFLERLNRRGEA